MLFAIWNTRGQMLPSKIFEKAIIKPIRGLDWTKLNFSFRVKYWKGQAIFLLASNPNNTTFEIALVLSNYAIQIKANFNIFEHLSISFCGRVVCCCSIQQFSVTNGCFAQCFCSGMQRLSVGGIVQKKKLHKNAEWEWAFWWEFGTHYQEFSGIDLSFTCIISKSKNAATWKPRGATGHETSRNNLEKDLTLHTLPYSSILFCLSRGSQIAKNPIPFSYPRCFDLSGVFFLKNWIDLFTLSLL